ncbi:nickel pincer cofactor biosynthesis protein LarC [Terracidiphilus gabretensis]|uniref:nickel pincer cofactor biosynthesis protein LarC n=1 Tax=Terracidiphilus gabretensis TaxID=1577687 RepID=UPI000A3EF821|nr:nickel pincer cofactor biosynthesis protein LarC [Terracidiphilus gabretensis]
MRIGYLECFSGISGDMFLGALVDAGVPLSHLAEVTAALHVGARLEARKVMRAGITATKVDVVTDETAHSHEHEQVTGTKGLRDQGTEALHAHSHEHEHSHSDEHSHGHSHQHEDHAHIHSHEHSHEHSHSHEHEQGHSHEHSHAHADEHGHSHSHEHSHSHSDEHGHTHEHSHLHEHTHNHEHSHEHRSLSTIVGILRGAALDEGVRARAIRGFEMLGEAEAAIHSMPVEEVHFHEVGAVDTIVDIVCAAAGAKWLGVDKWVASDLNVGSGTVKCAHGTLPVPAPATLKLLGDAPVYAAGPAMERVTPTGATILKMLGAEYATLPRLRVLATGYGAGGRDTAGEPNVLRVLVGEGADANQNEEKIAILETVIDDSTPQLLAYVSELLLAAGAWDVYRVPVQMKKGRTGVQMTVLCAPNKLQELREILFRETTTIGAHWRIETKMALKRDFAEVQTEWGAVRMKVARLAAGEVVNAQPEYEDCRKIAEERGVPLKQVMQAAVQAYMARTDAKKVL